MTKEQRVAIWSVVAIALGVVAATLIAVLPRPGKSVTLSGVVLRYDADPRKQQSIANVEIAAANHLSSGNCKSDASGLFHLTLAGGLRPGDPVMLTFRHPGYQPLDVAETVGKGIYIARMVPAAKETLAKPNQAEISISNARVRYSVKATTTLNVGSAVQTFEIVNTGNVPCNGASACSPDGKWKAAIGSTSLDAGEGSEFRNVRVSCIAGPCPFTKIESDTSSQGGRYVKVSVRNWSDTVTFLIEAEVTHTMVSEMVRHSYPATFGQAMNFTMPLTAQGASIEADVNGDSIVFPLGPNLNLSWALCSVQVASDHGKLYRCELKPGYVFR